MFHQNINPMTNKEFEKLGYTSKHPRGAFALKKQAKGVETTLTDVTWQVGKSGVVSPVAHFKTIKIGDALVSKATLHNIDYIRKKHSKVNYSDTYSKLHTM